MRQRGVNTPHEADQPPPLRVGVTGQLRKVRGEDVWVMAVLQTGEGRPRGGEEDEEEEAVTHVPLQQGN